MGWIVAGILFAVVLWIGSFLIGLFGAIWPYLLGGTILLFGGTILYCLGCVLFPNFWASKERKKHLREMEDKIDELNLDNPLDYESKELLKMIEEKENMI